MSLHFINPSSPPTYYCTLCTAGATRRRKTWGVLLSISNYNTWKNKLYHYSKDYTRAVCGHHGWMEGETNQETRVLGQVQDWKIWTTTAFRQSATCNWSIASALGTSVQSAGITVHQIQGAHHAREDTSSLRRLARLRLVFREYTL